MWWGTVKELYIDWTTKEELQGMDWKTRNRMTLNRCLHSRSSATSRLHMKQKEGGRGLISVEDCITTERRGLYDYLKESIKGDMLRWVEHWRRMWLRRERQNEEFTKRKRDERKKTLYEGKVTRTICRENQEHCTRAGTKNQFNESKDRQTTSFSQM